MEESAAPSTRTPHSTVSDIEESVWAELRKKPEKLYGLIVFAVVVDAFLLLTLIHDYRLIVYVFVLFFVSWSPLRLWYTREANKKQNAFWEAMAVSMDWVHSDLGTYSEHAALCLNAGHSRKMNQIITGVFADVPVKLFEIQYTAGRGKFKYNRMCNGVIFYSDSDLPHLYLNRLDDNFSFITNKE